MAKLYLLYESDPWHSYSSMTPTSLVGVATSETSLKKLLKKRVRESYKQIPSVSLTVYCVRQSSMQ